MPKLFIEVPMRKIKVFILLVLIFSLSSCLEIIEDLTVHTDGSGELKMTINLSQSATKINGIMALDSLNGKKVPSKKEIKEKLDTYTNRLRAKNGIRTVTSNIDFEHFILKLSIGFDGLDDFQNALIAIAEEDGSKNTEKWKAEQWITFQNSVFTKKSLPVVQIASEKIKTEDKEHIKDGKYISILRFDTEVKSVSNRDAKVSSNNKNIMIRYNPSTLLKNPSSIENTVVLK